MSINPNEQPETVIVCNPGAIDAANRQAHVDLSKEIFSASNIREVKALANGYAFRLPPETPMLYKVIQFIANERLCCSFFTFTLIVNEAIWLELTGSGEVKALIQSDILKIIDTGVFPTIAELEDVYKAATHS